MAKRLNLLLVFSFLFTFFLSISVCSDTAPKFEYNITFGTGDRDNGADVILTNDGGYAILGRQNWDGTNAWLIKLDFAGKQEWQKEYTGFSANSILQIDDGFVIAGSKIIKTDLSGNILSEKTLKVGFSQIKETKDGGFIGIGTTSVSRYYDEWGRNRSSDDVYVAKLNSSGDIEWDKVYDGDIAGGSYGGPASDAGVSIDTASDGGYILNTHSNYDYYWSSWENDVVIKLNSTGDILWRNTYSEAYHCDAEDIIETNDDNYAFISNCWKSGYDMGDAHTMFKKLNITGGLVFQKSIDLGWSYEKMFSLSQTSDGGYIISGVVHGYNGADSRMYTLKTDANGNEEWNIIHGNIGVLFSIKETYDGGYVGVGSSSMYSRGYEDIWVLKLKGKRYNFLLEETSKSEQIQNESLAIYNISSLNITITGDLTGKMNFSNYCIFINSGSYAKKGFFNSSIVVELENTSYLSVSKGIIYYDEARRRYFLNGVIQGEISGILDATIYESVYQSNNFDVYDGTLKLNRIYTQKTFSILNAKGFVVFSNPEFENDVIIDAVQSSFFGYGEGPDEISLSSQVTSTNIELSHENSSYDKKGFSFFTQMTPIGSGKIWSYTEKISNTSHKSVGFSTEPLEGVSESVYDEYKNPATLYLVIDKIDLGKPVGPHLGVSAFGPRGISPGQKAKYVLEYRNDGSKNAENVVVLVQIPKDSAFSSASNNAMYWDIKNQVFWKIGNLAPKQSGLLWVEVEYNWGLEDGQIHHIIPLIGTTSYQPNPEKLTFNSSMYINFTPSNHISTYLLSKEETQQELLDASFNELYQYAKDSGYAPVDVCVRQNFTDNTVVLKLMMVNESGSDFIFVEKKDNVSFLAKYSNQSVTYFDKTGGMEYQEGNYTSYGSWTVQGSCTKGQCTLNCFIINGIGALDPTALSRSKDCMDCVSDPKGDWDACVGCAVDNNKFTVPISVTKCIKECMQDQHSNCCEVGSSFTQCEPCALSVRVGQCSNTYNCRWPGELYLYSSISCGCGGFPRDPWSEASLVQQCLYCEACINGQCYCDECQPGMDKSGTSVPHDPNAKYGPEGTVEPGQLLSYTIEYENEGNGTAFGVYFTDTLDINLNVSTLEIGPVIAITNDSRNKTIIAPKGTYNNKTRTITWFVGEVGPHEGGYTNISIAVNQNASYGVDIINYATVYFPSVFEVTKTNAIVSTVYDVFNFTLTPGWNLISLPLEPIRKEITEIFDGCNYSRIWSFENNNKNWISTDTGLSTMEINKGYWVDRAQFSDSCSMLLKGTNIVESSVETTAGWNLIGYASKQIIPLSLAINKDDYDIMWTFNLDKSWSSTDTGLSIFRPQNAYWIYANKNTNVSFSKINFVTMPVLELKEGWNKFTWDYLDSYNISYVLEYANVSLGIDYDHIIKFDEQTKSELNYYGNDVDDLKTFDPNGIYYIHMLSNKTVNMDKALSISFLKSSLRYYSMERETGGNVDTLLVPLMNPDANVAYRPTAFKDVYHLFASSVLIPVLVEDGDLETVDKIVEFYLVLYEDKNLHPELWNNVSGKFDGFPEIYKDLSGSENLSGDIQSDPGNFDFTTSELDFSALRIILKERRNETDIMLLDLLNITNISDVNFVEQKLDERENKQIQDALNSLLLIEKLYENVSDTNTPRFDEIRNLYENQNKEDFLWRELLKLNRGMLRALYEDGTKNSALLRPQYRGMGPNSWFANALSNYWFALNERRAPGDDLKMQRVQSLLESLGDWLGYLQDDALDYWILENNLTREDVPYLNGSIAGSIDENTRKVNAGPYTEGSAAAYAVFRKLELIENISANFTKSQEYKMRADRLGAWFRYVIDGETGRVYVGRNLEGKLIEGIPKRVAEAVDVYGFLVLCGVADTALSNKFIDRVDFSGSRIDLIDNNKKEISGLAFGPQAENAIFWGPHGQVDVAAWYLNNSYDSKLYSDMKQRNYDGRMTVFTPDGNLSALQQIDDWTGQPSEEAWVGWIGQYAIEPTSWYYMRNFLSQGYNILGPTDWQPVILNNDPLLGAKESVKMSYDDFNLPSTPMVNNNSVTPFDIDKPYLYTKWSSNITRVSRAMFLINISEGGRDEKILMFSYDGVSFPNYYNFYIFNAKGNITNLEIEFKDKNEKDVRYYLWDLQQNKTLKVTLDLEDYLLDVNQTNINKVLFHLVGYGEVYVDGFVTK